LHVVSLYLTYRQKPPFDVVPRTFLFAGKAAPGYDMAKRIIALINAVGQTINNDVNARQFLRVIFVPNYSVSMAELIVPATDVSEQISTAGTEASGTGNMKFSMNGALTIGTLDGANVELRDEVGAENFFLFGLTAPEVEELRRGGYRPIDYYRRDSELATVVDLIRSGFFSRGDTELFDPLLRGLLDHDPYFVFADFAAYVDCQRTVADVYRDRDRWTRMSILNAARTGKFSSDRTIREYCRDIWRVQAVPIKGLPQGEPTHDELAAMPAAVIS
jgi:starch phosphorylase